jgi:LuxR family maltose regulon positive regulatory protein
MLNETKFQQPPFRQRLLPRPRLQAALEQAHPLPLTLVCAPADYGKTTAIAQWIHGRGRAFAWLVLDDRDNDAARFWLYVAAALQRAGVPVPPGTADATPAARLAPSPPATSTRSGSRPSAATC